MNSNKQYILLMIKRFENRFLMNILVHLLTLHRWRVDCQNIEVVFTGFAYIQKITFAQLSKHFNTPYTQNKMQMLFYRSNTSFLQFSCGNEINLKLTYFNFAESLHLA